MTKYTNNSVAITYWKPHEIDIFSSDEDVPWNYSQHSKRYEMLWSCVSKWHDSMRIYRSWQRYTGILEMALGNLPPEVTSSGHFVRLSRSQSDEILMTQHSNYVSIYDPSGKHTQTQCANYTRRSLTRHLQRSRVWSSQIVLSGKLNIQGWWWCMTETGIPGGIYNLHMVSTCITPWTSRTGCM